MPQLLWDASALIKRYYTEQGIETVNAIFSISPSFPMTATFLGYAETAVVLRRRLNQGVLTSVAFHQARLNLRQEVLINPDFDLLTVDDADILDGIALNDRHNLNASDAAILAAQVAGQAASSYLPEFGRSQFRGSSSPLRGSWSLYPCAFFITAL